LPQERFGGHALDIEAVEQFVIRPKRRQLRREEAALRQNIDEKRGRPRLEPVGPELPFVKKQQKIERVLDRLAQPVVAVIPVEDRLSVKPLQFRCKDGIDIRFRVATDGLVGRIDRDVVEVVQAREDRDFAELGYTGQEGELNVGVLVLDDRVEVAQALTHGAGNLRPGEVVEDGLVVFIDEHHSALAKLLHCSLDEVGKAAGNVV